jgi:hypothetical protein
MDKPPCQGDGQEGSPFPAASEQFNCLELADRDRSPGIPFELFEQAWLYQNPWFHTLPAHTETTLFHATQMRADAVPQSTVSGTQRSRLTGNDWRILTKPTALGSHADGVVVKPLSDTSLCFETCVIMRADDDSRLVNEYVRMFLRKYAPQRLPAKQMELWLSA